MRTIKRFVNIETLPKAVDRVNRMRKWINTNFNMINDVMAGARRLKSGELDKKSRDAMAEIFETLPANVTGWVRTDFSHCVILELKTCFKMVTNNGMSHGSYKYIEETINFKPGFPTYDWVPLEIFKVSQVLDRLTNYNEKNALVEAAEEALYEAGKGLHPFQL